MNQDDSSTSSSSSSSSDDDGLCFSHKKFGQTNVTSNTKSNTQNGKLSTGGRSTSVFCYSSDSDSEDSNHDNATNDGGNGGNVGGGNGNTEGDKAVSNTTITATTTNNTTTTNTNNNNDTNMGTVGITPLAPRPITSSSPPSKRPRRNTNHRLTLPGNDMDSDATTTPTPTPTNNTSQQKSSKQPNHSNNGYQPSVVLLDDSSSSSSSSTEFVEEESNSNHNNINANVLAPSLQKAREAREALERGNRPLENDSDDDDDDGGDGDRLGDDHKEEKEKVTPVVVAGTKPNVPFEIDLSSSPTTTTTTQHSTLRLNNHNYYPAFTTVDLHTTVQAPTLDHPSVLFDNTIETVPCRAQTPVTELLDSYRKERTGLMKRNDVRLECSYRGVVMREGTTVGEYVLPSSRYTTGKREVVRVTVIVEPSFVSSTVSSSSSATVRSQKTNGSMPVRQTQSIGSIPLPPPTTGNNTISTPTSKDRHEPRVDVVTRIKGGDPSKTHVFRLKIGDPLSKIITAHRTNHGYSSFKAVSLEFDGRRLKEEDVAKSPAFYGIGVIGADVGLSVRRDGGVGVRGVGGGGGGGRIVEIVDEAERQRQVARLPKGFRLSDTVVPSSPLPSLQTPSTTTNTNTSNPIDTTTTNNNNTIEDGNTHITPGEIPLLLRTDGDTTSVLTLSLHPKRPFRTLIQQYYAVRQARNLPTEGCRFEFDGCVLNENGTPEDEDLEGGEMIDVTTAEGRGMVKEKVKKRGTVVTVQTIRNNSRNARPKRFRLLSSDTFVRLKEGYVSYYKKKGCRSVKFYFKNTLIGDINKTLGESGVGNMDTIFAIENGKKYVMR